jgi:ABC-type branched-subunit amino acid transport system ATPase component
LTIALETVALEKRFDELVVTRDLSLRVEARARHALIGPNGAGKTTVINLLTVFCAPMPGAFCSRALTSRHGRCTSAYGGDCPGHFRSTSSMRI